MNPGYTPDISAFTPSVSSKHPPRGDEPLFPLAIERLDMNSQLFGVGVQNLIVADVDPDVADIQPACAEE